MLAGTKWTHPKLETFLCSSRQSEVSVVNGIKGSAKESDVHNLFNSQIAVLCFVPRVSLDSRNPEFWTPGDIHRPNSL